MTPSPDSPLDDAAIERFWDACTKVLHRPPIDRFEAAVTLEAHDGLGAAHALGVGRRFAEQGRFLSGEMADPNAVDTDLIDRVPVAPSPDEPDRAKRLLGEVVFMISVLMVGFWVSSMADELGLAAVDHAWRIALPASLGAQWFLRRRYLSGEHRTRSAPP